MIQRIQSLYLLLLIICFSLGLFFLPPLEIPELSFSYTIYLESYLILSIFMSALALFIFKYRKIQLLINSIQLFLQTFVLLGLIFVMLSANAVDGFLPWLSMPILAIIFLLMSNRAIRKDEALVRSIDRLR